MKQTFTPAQAYQHLIKNGYPVNAMCTNNFSWDEVLVHQVEIPTLNILENLQRATRLLQKYRDEKLDKKSITITSGWRSESYNKKVGGATKSYHSKGMALDFTVSGFKPSEVQSLLDPIHKGGMEYAPTWTHIDIRGYTVRFKP